LLSLKDRIEKLERGVGDRQSHSRYVLCGSERDKSRRMKRAPFSREGSLPASPHHDLLASMTPPNRSSTCLNFTTSPSDDFSKSPDTHHFLSMMNIMPGSVHPTKDKGNLTPVFSSFTKNRSFGYHVIIFV
jgi:hypothetical protein